MHFKRDDLKNLSHFFRDLVDISGWHVAISLVLQILTGFTQGIGLLMLIPLLGVVGIFQDQAKVPEIITTNSTNLGLIKHSFTVINSQINT